MKEVGKIRILQNGGGWITNIGNAFIDLASMACLRKATTNADVQLTSVLHRWIFYHVSRGLGGFLLKQSGETKNVFNLQNYADIDYIVQCGACLSKHWFQLHGDILFELSRKGVKVIINGGGIAEGAYPEEEIERTRKCLRKLKPYIFISRDRKTFESFEDLAEFSYDGIDCSFWVNDAYTPLRLDMPKFIVLNFDKHPEPKNLNFNKKVIVRTHHSFWHNFPIGQYFRMKKNYYDRKNTLISELPYDYLNLYANTSVTYSDRVHACVATLSYGNPARLFGSPSRVVLFEKIGASKITEKIIKPNLNKIEKEKQKQTDFLSRILKD